MADTKISISDVRAKFPQYADVGDDQLLRALHQKHYSDIPEQQFMAMVDRPSASAPANVAPLSRTDKVVMGAMDPIHGGAQLLTHILPTSVVNGVNKANNWLADNTGLVARIPEGGVDQMVADREREYQARRRASEPQSITSLVTGQTQDPGFDGYRALGNVISPANLAIASKAPVAVSLLGRVGVGSAAGATSAALNPVVGGDGFAEEKAKQLLMGGAAGAAIPAAGNVLGRMVNPLAAQNPLLQLLKNEGVRPTIGQTLGGMWNTAEQKATSIPFVGDMISKARTNSLRDFNNAAINRAATPIGESVGGSGSGAVREAGDRLSMAYDAGKAQLGNFKLDQQAATELGSVAQLAANLPAKEQATFRQLMEIVKKEVSPNGTILPDQFKRIDSKLGSEASQFSGSSDVYQQKLGDATKELQRVITEAAKRANPNGAAALDAADAGYANLVRVEQAAKAAANNEGVFTPAQLMNAIKATDQSVRGRGVARGGALMQDLANAGQTVLGNKVPDSGTAGRMLFSGGLGAAGLAEPVMVGSSLALGSGLYTQPVQNVLRAMVSSRGANAAPISNALRNGAPYLSPAAAQALLQGRN